LQALFNIFRAPPARARENFFFANCGSGRSQCFGEPGAGEADPVAAQPRRRRPHPHQPRTRDLRSPHARAREVFFVANCAGPAAGATGGSAAPSIITRSRRALAAGRSGRRGRGFRFAFCGCGSSGMELARSGLAGVRRPRRYGVASDSTPFAKALRLHLCEPSFWSKTRSATRDWNAAEVLLDFVVAWCAAAGCIHRCGPAARLPRPHDAPNQSAQATGRSSICSQCLWSRRINRIS
jgi:hypothetical protein